MPTKYRQGSIECRNCGQCYENANFVTDNDSIICKACKKESRIKILNGSNS